MAPLFEMVGERFGRLLVVSRDGRFGCGARWLCQCDCGNQSTVSGYDLRSGHSKSCGCGRADAARANNTTHGHARQRDRTTEYTIWSGMLGRCRNPNNSAYPNYGGRGITVCERWVGSFDAFLADVGSRPSSEHSIDRIDNDGHYEPGNVRWATASEQSSNRRAHKRHRQHMQPNRRKRKDLQVLGEPNPLVSCACGCGQQFLRYDDQRKPRRFAAAGHAPRTKRGDVARALEVVGADHPWAKEGQLRVKHPYVSLADLATMADPPLTRAALASRIRRLLRDAERAS